METRSGESACRIMVAVGEKRPSHDLIKRVKELGYCVSSVVFSDEPAVKRIATGQCDLVLADIRLADSVQRVLVAAGAEIPVVFIVAPADQEEQYRADLSGSFGCLLEPFTDLDFKVAVETAFRLFREKCAQNQAEERQKLALGVLEILNLEDPTIDTIRQILLLIKEATGFTAVGVRLRVGDDFPYHASPVERTDHKM